MLRSIFSVKVGNGVDWFMIQIFEKRFGLLNIKAAICNKSFRKVSFYWERRSCIYLGCYKVHKKGYHPLLPWHSVETFWHTALLHSCELCSWGGQFYVRTLYWFTCPMLAIRSYKHSTISQNLLRFPYFSKNNSFFCEVKNYRCFILSSFNIINFLWNGNYSTEFKKTITISNIEELKIREYPYRM